VREFLATGGKDAAYTTIMTTLSRLYSKGLLAREYAPWSQQAMDALQDARNALRDEFFQERNGVDNVC
jgi:predicted transcriptional regulator